MESKFLIQKIKKLNFLSSEDSVRYELYSILTILILSKEVFKRNNDVDIFLKEIDIKNRNYIIKSRTAMLGKSLRTIEEADSNKLKIFKEKLLWIYEKYVYEEETQEENYVKSMLKKYSRDNRNE
ncbi:hypothetical protein [Clostridium massiliodielmoense]|uniref:hypothetical protein n=1 Tax=Clostridium massiliodielmoense TaxID=1776385 RepID=UPI000A26ADC5|nr:hypothetical protein [Clostridium massiliodielmoense]